MCRYGERKLNEHTRRITLDRRIYKLSDLGKLNYILNLRLDLLLGHTEDRTVHEYILTTGQFRMETGSDLQHRCNTTVHLDRTGRRRGDLRDQLQKCTFTGAVMADNADSLALIYGKIDIVQRKELLTGFSFSRAVNLTGRIFETLSCRALSLKLISQSCSADHTKAIFF